VQFKFGDCVFDLKRRELTRMGELVHTRAKVFDTLEYIIVNRDRVVSREDLLDHAWQGLTVSDATLSTCIRSIRAAIGDDVKVSRFIKTFRGKGFRFVGDVECVDTELKTPQQDRPDQSTDARHRSHTGTLSIAVLPFSNLNGEPELAYLTDGLAEDVITRLSCFKAFSVIAKNSSFQYKTSEEGFQKIGFDLQVDYILEGSIRCSGGSFRASVQLIYAPSEKCLWAEKYDGKIDDILALQDEITQQIVTSIAPEIALEEFRWSRKPKMGDLGALEMAWRARTLLDRGRSEAAPELFVEGMKLAEAAVESDPQCRQAWWTVSFANYTLAFGKPDSSAKSLLVRAREAAERLRALDRNDHRAFGALGWISFIERDIPQADEYLRQAHDLNPNCTMTLTMLGLTATSLGKSSEGYENICQAIRLSPRDLWLGFMVASQGVACFALERFEEGVICARRAIQLSPHAPLNHIILAACMVESNDLAGARAALVVQRRINEGVLTQYLRRQRGPFQDDKMADRYADALAVAMNEK
jgi:TolB-like protein